MALTDKQIKDLNNMSTAAKNAELGNLLDSLESKSGGGDLQKILKDFQKKFDELKNSVEKSFKELQDEMTKVELRDKITKVELQDNVIKLKGDFEKSLDLIKFSLSELSLKLDDHLTEPAPSVKPADPVEPIKEESNPIDA